MEMCEDLALISYQTAEVHMEFDRKRQNRLAMILSYSGLKECDQKASTPTCLAMTALVKEKVRK